MLPIPVSANSQFAGGDEFTYAEMMARHGIERVRAERGWHAVNDGIHCHLDPDLIRDIVPGRALWRAAFGQSDTAEGHLRKRCVTVGDVFLFFGVFRHGGDAGFDPDSAKQHVLFGYLQIGEILRTDLPNFQPPPWPHPHFAPQYMMNGARRRKNGVYAASEELVIDRRGLGVPGHGVFRYDEARRLTRPDANGHSEWALPAFFRGLQISYHGRAYGWRNGYFKSANQGQEFVFGANDAALAWFAGLRAHRHA